MLQNCKVINVSPLLTEKIVLEARDLSIPFVTSLLPLLPLCGYRHCWPSQTRSPRDHCLVHGIIVIDLKSRAHEKQKRKD